MPNRTRHPQRTRVDWGQAEAFYVALAPGQRSYGRVSREFGVSETSVRKWAKRLEWERKAAEADARAASAALAAGARSREEIAVATARIHDAAQDELLRRLREAPADLTGADLVRAYRESGHQRRLDEGQATTIVELGDVQAIIGAVFTVAGRFVPGERRDEFMRELDGAVGGLMVVEGGRAG